MKVMIEMITKNEQETKKAARLLAQEIIKKPLKTKGAVVIGLEGELGSGKTRFVQGFARGLGIRQRLTSPTFVILRRHAIPASPAGGRDKQYANLYHIDCYRLNKSKDLLDLDFKEITNNSQNITIIEWAEKVKKILPRDAIWIRFRIISDKERKIKII